MDVKHPLYIVSEHGSQYTVLAQIGHGAYGYVLKVQQNTSGDILAIKVVPAPVADTAERSVQREIKFYEYNKANDCANVVHTFSQPWFEIATREKYLTWRKNMRFALKVLENDEASRFIKGLTTLPQIKTYFIPMKFYPLGNLESWVCAITGLYNTRLCFFRDVVNGVNELHRRGLIHRDICPGNVLLESVNGRTVALLSDFGTVISYGETPFWKITNKTNRPYTRRVGTDPYAAPETAGTDYNASCDIYSLGVVLLRLLWKHDSFSDFYNAISTILNDKSPTLNCSVPDAEYWLDLIAKLVSRDQHKRPDCGYILRLERLGESLQPDIPCPKDLSLNKAEHAEHELSHMKNAVRRMRGEFRQWENEPIPGISGGPILNDLLHWHVVMEGPMDSHYEGGFFHLDVVFTPQYPFHPPKITFLTRIFHPNINKYGYICMDILESQWCPALNISKTVLSVQSLLTDPNAENALVPEIGVMYVTDRQQYDKVAREWTKRYAMNQTLADEEIV